MRIKKHFNKPQLRSMYVGAPVEVLVAGRAMGKTIGLLAPKTAQVYFKQLPRGTGVNINATYTQAFTRTLKELIRGWQSIGYIMDVHFLVGRRPTDKWKKMWRWQGPFAPPLDYKFTVSWFNSSCMQVLSQDRPGGSNGLSIDWIVGDEVKFLNVDKLRAELFPANRGFIPEFDGNPYHHGITFTTDMPTSVSSKWVLDYEKACDLNKVKEILRNQKIIHNLKKYYPKLNKPVKLEIDKQIDVLLAEINDLRKGLVFFHEASTLDNIHALGLDYIKQQIRDTSPFLFDVQILNLRPNKPENGFYPDFDEDIHGYFSEHDEYFDNGTIDYLNPVFDCRKDGDLDLNKPLHIALDYNKRIHPLVVSQVNDREIKILNGLHVLYPKKLVDIVEEFCQYYRFMKRRLVYYWYDHTAVGDQHKTRICDDVVDILRKHKFIVKRMYTNKAPNHEKKYRMWGNLLTANSKYDKTFSMNRENCKQLIISMNNTGTTIRKDGFGKDKKTEEDINFPAEDSTHYGDALDMLVYGLLECNLYFNEKDSINSGGFIIG